ncbi:MAG: tetratricopeptide repeat protein, partial [Rhodobacteraceae bacterium]|nr:tetratricopeptide repeat protein [Paracoccaceae bacterium]
NAQNRGILYQTRAENSSDPTRRTAYLRQAAASVEECLAIMLEMGNQVGAALSYMELGKTYRLLGDFEQAEKQLHQALQLHESLNIPDVFKTYWNLAALARDRGNAAAAAQWQAKYDAKRAELDARNRADGAGQAANPLANPQLVQFVAALAQAAYQARAANASLPPEAAEALAELMEQPGALGQIGLFLSAIVAGEAVPAVPAGLPPQLTDILQALVAAL